MAEIGTVQVEHTPEELTYLQDSGKAPPPAKEEAKTEPGPKAEPSGDKARDEKGRFAKPAGEEAPKEEPKVEPDEEAKADAEKAKQQPNPPRRTPQETIKELRASRRQLRQEHAEFRQKAEERLQALAAQLQRPVHVPDPELEPDAYRQHIETENKALRDQKQQELESLKKQQEQSTHFAELQNFVEEQEDDYADSTPDYFEAIEWGKAEYAKRLQDQYGMSEADAKAAVYQIIINEATRIRGIKGASVPHYLYRTAEELGWNKQAVPEAKEEPKDPDADAKKIATEVAAKLKPLQDGKAAAKGARGTGGAGNLTLEELVAMSDEEFVKFSNTKTAKKLFGE